MTWYAARLQITVGDQTLAEQICSCPTKSQVWSNMMSGQFFDCKSFYGNNVYTVVP